MYYRINVSRKNSASRAYAGAYSHFFATAPQSLRDWRAALDAFDIFREKFPESEGYRITVQEIPAASSTDVTVSFIQNLEEGGPGLPGRSEPLCDRG